MTATPIADEIDHDVLAKLHPVIDRDLRDEQHFFRIVAVHVEDRRLHHARDFGAVFGRSRIVLPARGEADLVVDDQMNRAAGFEATRLRHLERLHHHALPGESGVAMDDDRHDEIAGVVEAPILTGANRAFGDRSDDLEM